MSFKDGIPLLKTLDDDEDISDEDFAVELSNTTRHRWSKRKHLVFGLVLGLVVFVVVAVIVGVTVPVVLLQQQPSPSPSPDQLLQEYKPASDERDYSFLTLSNSLRVLIVSDPKSNVSAASMDIPAGSFSDPSDTEGLAHFCEHMLFLGTEKYPNDHEYSNYLTSHGGYDNAFTSIQNTNYYFSVDSGFLEGALDRFAQFFVSPLFCQSSVTDEVHAVNSEHEKNLNSDGWKRWQLLKHVSNPDHPFSQFSTGTLTTLNRSDLLDALKSYYQSSYSANTMQLAVYGKADIDTLTDWVVNSFVDIPNRHLTPLTFSNTAFPSDYSGKMVFFYPVADTNSLFLYWQITPTLEHYRNDLVEFLSNYLGNEAEGRILDWLKKEQLATSLYAGSRVDADSFSVFVVSIELTEDGLGRTSDVVKRVFSFIRMLSNMKEEELKKLWNNHLAVSQVVYDYGEPESPSSYAEALSQRMNHVRDPQDFLNNPRRLVFDFTLISSVLSTLSDPSNLVLFVGSQHADFSSSLNDSLGITPKGRPTQTSTDALSITWPKIDRLEPIYTTPYAEVDIPTDVSKSWTNSVASGSPIQQNPFIPSNWDILPPPPPSVPSDIPTKLQESDGVSLWWLQDTTFETPRVNMECSVQSTDINTTSVRSAELMSLYVMMVSEVLTPVLYPANEVTYIMNMFATPSGFQLAYSGFSDPDIFTKFINTSVSYMRNYDKLKEVFDLVKERRQDSLENFKYQNHAYAYTDQYIQQVIMNRPYWKVEEELSEGGGLTVDDVIAQAEVLFSDASFLCFSHGNLNQDMAKKYTELVVKALSPSTPATTPAPQGGYMRERVRLADPGSYSVSLPTLNPDDKNSVVNVVFQVGPTCSQQTGSETTPTCSDESILTNAHLGLLNQIIGDLCFYQLRTVEQLGYVVRCRQSTYSGTSSFQLLVQSQEYNTSYVLGRINRFLDDLGTSVVANYTVEQLQDNKELYARSLRKTSQTLVQENSRLWGEVRTGRRQFDYSQLLLDALDSITPQSLQQFYQTYILDPTTHRKLILGVYGVDKPVDLSSQSDYCIDWDNLNHSVLEYTSSNSNCLSS